MSNQYRLFTPGPTEIPAVVQAELNQPIIHHRTEEFEAIFASAQQGLVKIYQTENQVMILASSGTGAMEACVINFFSAGETVLVINIGKFGERWQQLANAYGLNVIELKYLAGTVADLEQVQQTLAQNKNIVGVFFQASETSTATYNPVKQIAQSIRKFSQALLIVDAITAIGVHDLRVTEWDLDLVISGSQKGFMLPPGLSFLSVSERAWQRSKSAKLPKFYFDLNKERQSQVKNTTAFTPAISLIRGLNKANELLLEEGLENVFTRCKKMMQIMHAAASALGLKLVAPKNPSHCLTAFYIPEEIGAKHVKKLFQQDHKMIIAGGQGDLSGKIIRIAHFGALKIEDALEAINALEAILIKLGMKNLELGKAKEVVEALGN